LDEPREIANLGDNNWILNLDPFNGTPK
jgi:hypothetical protein